MGTTSSPSNSHVMSGDTERGKTFRTVAAHIRSTVTWLNGRKPEYHQYVITDLPL